LDKEAHSVTAGNSSSGVTPALSQHRAGTLVSTVFPAHNVEGPTSEMLQILPALSIVIEANKQKQVDVA
jgi:hypothetical protein